ncbi:MAG: BON domain-containing protein [Immundisolibacterales bacterium]|nr:BON domain-containing protein [Immundisolibacterales bacterium]
MIRTSVTLPFVLVLVLLLEGCGTTALLGAAGVAGTGAVSVDRRTTGTMVEDETIEWKVRVALTERGLSDERHRVSVTSFNRIVLLTGQFPDEEAKRRAAAEAERVDQVRGVHNEIVVGPTTSISRRSTDVLLTGHVRIAMATNPNSTAPSNVNVKVVTENGVVFLMGLVTREEGKSVTETARKVPGVAQIVRLFEYLDNRRAG